MTIRIARFPSPADGSCRPATAPGTNPSVAAAAASSAELARNRRLDIRRSSEESRARRQEAKWTVRALVHVPLVEYIRAMKKLSLSASVLALAALSTVAVRGQNASGPVAAAAAAIGAGTLRSIQYSGWGSDYIFGQAYDGGSSWPRFGLPGITIAMDYTTTSLR